MSRAMFLRIFIGLFGIVFIVLTFWLSAHFHLSTSTKLVIILAFALATFFAEVIIAIDNLDELPEIKEIMEEQEENNIDVSYTFRSNLDKMLPYASFAISEEQTTGIISHREDSLGKVTITSNNEIITDLATKFDDIKRQSIKLGSEIHQANT
ncbi:MAG: hypothetical protein ACYDB0_09290 [Acidithiobacillus sp.]